jgi:hypothetical protein
MDFATIDSLRARARNARSIRVRRGYFGNCTIQFAYGPWGVFREEFTVDQQVLQELRTGLAAPVRAAKRPDRPVFAAPAGPLQVA